MKSRNRNCIKTSRFGNNRIIPTQSLDSSTVSFSTLQAQMVNGVNKKAEAQNNLNRFNFKVDLLYRSPYI